MLDPIKCNATQANTVVGGQRQMTMLDDSCPALLANVSEVPTHAVIVRQHCRP